MKTNEFRKLGYSFEFNKHSFKVFHRGIEIGGERGKYDQHARAKRIATAHRVAMRIRDGDHRSDPDDIKPIGFQYGFQTIDYRYLAHTGTFGLSPEEVTATVDPQVRRTPGKSFLGRWADKFARLAGKSTA